LLGGVYSFGSSKMPLKKQPLAYLDSTKFCRNDYEFVDQQVKDSFHGHSKLIAPLSINDFLLGIFMELHGYVPR